MKLFISSVILAVTLSFASAAPLVLTDKSDPKVTAIQENLIKLGYLKGPADGFAGPATNAALARYQAKAATPAPKAGMTSAQRKLAQSARAEVVAALAGQASALAEADQAKQSATDSAASAAYEKTLLDTAVAQSKEEQAQLKKAATENAQMRPIVKQVQSYWGIGGIIYGFKRLAAHLLILAAVIAVLVVGIWILSIAAPATAPIIMLALRAVGGVFSAAGRGVAAFFGMLHRLLQKLLTKKPAPMLAPVPVAVPVPVASPAPVSVPVAVPVAPTSMVPWIKELVAAEESVAPAPIAPLPEPIAPIAPIAPPPNVSVATAAPSPDAPVVVAAPTMSPSVVTGPPNP